MKVLIICTSNKDRSPQLENYFKVEFPKHEYKSAGINKYHCSTKGTRYISQEDIDWCDFFVFCEQIHQDIVFRTFQLYDESNPEKKKGGIILGLGHYEKGNITNDYLLRAKDKLKKILE